MDERNLADAAAAVHDQRNALATQITRAEDGDELRAVERLVGFVADLWTALGYGCKLVELRQRIKARAAELLAAEEEYIRGCRKNDRTRASAAANASRLAELAE